MKFPRYVAAMTATAVAMCPSARANADVIFNSFGNGNAIQNGIAWDVNSSFETTAQFIAYANFEITEIDLALFNLSGTNAATISLLAAKADGSPGPALHTWKVAGQPQADTGPLTRIRDVCDLHIQIGKTYFLRIAPADSTTMDVWILSQNASTTIYNGAVLAYPSTTAPAFDIIGYAVPNTNVSKNECRDDRPVSDASRSEG